jgi:hypothetical protein
VYAVLQQYGKYALASMCIVGFVVMFFRARASQVAYLKRFPLVNGVPLEMSLAGNPGGAQAQAISRVSRTRQDDPELERLRQAMARRYRQFLYWTFGFPVLATGVPALVLIFFLHRTVRNPQPALCLDKVELRGR